MPLNYASESEDNIVGVRESVEGYRLTYFSLPGRNRDRSPHGKCSIAREPGVPEWTCSYLPRPWPMLLFEGRRNLEPGIRDDWLSRERMGLHLRWSHEAQEQAVLRERELGDTQ